MPEVERLLRSLIQLRREYERIDTELGRVTQKIALAGGMIAPREEIGQLRMQKSDAARNLKAVFERIQDIGCQVKDLEIGLIDFPTLYRGKEVYLCWKLGEAGIGFWHHVEDGFRGRHPIDSEFIANHSGDR